MSQHEGNSFRSINEDWIIQEAPKAFHHFLDFLFEQVLRGSFLAIDKPVANLAYGVCGTEIEGDEISIGMMFVPGREPASASLREAAISSSVRHEWRKKDIKPYDLKDPQLSVLRKVIDVMRDAILGWTPGYYEHPVLVFTYGDDDHPTNINLLGSHLLRCDTPVLDIEYVYENFSLPGSLAIWIKPHSTIRIYHAGAFLGHIVKLRDTNSWALRSLRHLERFFSQEAGIMNQDLTPAIIKTGRIRKILRAMMTISEEKRGAALYIISETDFIEGMKPGDPANNEEPGFISRAKHRLYEGGQYNINNMPLGELLTYLRQDGSVVIDEEGNWLGAGVYFRSPGGRKGSAEEVAKNRNGHVFVVSEDGGLFFYSNAVDKDFTTPPPGEDKVAYTGVRLDFLPIGKEPFEIRNSTP